MNVPPPEDSPLLPQNDGTGSFAGPCFPLVPLPPEATGALVDYDQHQTLRKVLVGLSEETPDVDALLEEEAPMPSGEAGDAPAEDFEELADRVVGGLLRVRREKLRRQQLRIGLIVLASLPILAGVVALGWWLWGDAICERISHSFAGWRPPGR